MMSDSLTHLTWKPVILLKIVRLPFGTSAGVSLKRAYLALHEEKLLYADWTLEAAERTQMLVCPTGWMFPYTSSLNLPLKLQGQSPRRIPSGTWVLPYSDGLFRVYNTLHGTLLHITSLIDRQPNHPATIAKLIRLTRLL